MFGKFRLVLALVLAAAMVPTTASAEVPWRPAHFTPGAAGIGDPYFPLDGNGGYDVAHYDLQLKYAAPDPTLIGRTTIVALATQDLSAFDLDFIGMTVQTIRVNGLKATWTRDGQELVVTPRLGLRKGWPFVVTVSYAGVPEPIFSPIDGYGWVATDDGALVIQEPHGAATWFPVNDHPADKATYAMHIAVPDGTEAIGNGHLTNARTSNGWTTWNWSMNQPMASYLATATIGQFDLTQYRQDGIDYVDAIDPDLFSTDTGAAVQAALARDPEVLAFEATLFGPYPFTDAGGIVDDLDDVGFALENQSRPIYAREFFGDPAEANAVVVHENAHQWFGDSVSVQRWQDIWLNEGFATYAEWLADAEFNGIPTEQSLQYYYDGYSADDPFWTIPVADPGPDDLFGAPVYNRGAMTLQVLRDVVGDDAFFGILQKWASSKAGGNGSTAEFVALAEQMSGQDLTDLFQTWLYTPSKPELSFAAARVAGLPAPWQVDPVIAGPRR